MSSSSLQRALERAIRGRRGESLRAKFKRPEHADVLAAYGALIVFVLIALCIYIATPAEPFAFYKDMGFAHEAAAGAVYTLHRPIDVVDALAWAPWYNAPLFRLNSNLSEMFLTCITWLAGNAWLAMKIVQVLEVLVAAAAGYAMYATHGKSKLWALVFGLSYAALPATALAIRGNPAFGWLAALPPLALALGTLALRRYGPRALPLVGCLCGIVGYGIALEYAAFTTLPLYALVVAGERRRINSIASMLLAVAGLFCCATIGAFYVLPSFIAPLFSDTATRTVSLVSGAFLGNFSETWQGLLTLVPRENYASPFPEFNVSGSLPGLYAFGALIWLAATANIVRTKQRLSGWTDYFSIAIVAICAILAMGTAIPFGRTLWNAIIAVPYLDAIRTTDRFLAVPSLLVLFWYVCSLEELARIRPFGRRAGAYASLAVILAFIAFDVAQHCFSVDSSKGVRQPNIDAVQRVVEAAGGRTASFAGVNGGWGFEDASEYGVPVPIAPAFADLGWRFIQDGNGSVGILGRMGVHTVISAPAWTKAADFPDASAIFRRLSSARLVYSSPENVLVSTIADRPDVSAAVALCVYGGPGGFDLLDGVPALRQTAFLEQTSRCGKLGLVNFDPRDILPNTGTLESWSGARLFPAARRIDDGDYRFVPNRVLLNVPWYRNSIDGDRPVFNAAGAVELAATAAVTLPSQRAWPPGSRLAIRLCSHVTGSLAIDAGAAFAGTIHVGGAPGFRWYEVRLGRTKAAAQPVTITFLPDRRGSSGSSNAFALDGVTVGDGSLSDMLKRPAAFAAISLDRFDRGTIASPDIVSLIRPDNVAATAKLSEMHLDNVADQPVLLADAAISHVSLPWRGPNGLYAVRVSAFLSRPGGTLGLDAASHGSCCRLATTNASGPDAVLLGRVRLVHGSPLVVRLTSADFTSDAMDRITAVDVARANEFTLSTPAASGASGTLDFGIPFDALARLSEVKGIRFESALANGVQGSALAAKTPLRGHPRGITLDVTRVGSGDATATLKCDGASAVSAPLNNDDTLIAVSGVGFTACTTIIRWRAGSLGIRRIRLTAGGASLPPGVADVWLPAGTYRASLIADDGRLLPLNKFASSGCSGSPPVCHFMVAATRRVEMGETQSAARLLLFSAVAGVHEPPRARFDRTAALRWDVDLEKTTTIALTQMYDGNWILANDTVTYAGERCDITNTCFTAVPAGHYKLYHRWPIALRLGFGMTAGVLLLSLACNFIPPIRARRAMFEGAGDDGERA